MTRAARRQNQSWDRRKPRYLLSGLVMCGVCALARGGAATVRLAGLDVASAEGAAQPGEIYVSEPCYMLCEGHIRFEALGRKGLKGFVDFLAIDADAATGDWIISFMR
jgi:hypothetical protein